jgi:ribonuclease P protein component
VRTRVKRQVREWFRRRVAPLPAGKDLVVIARPGAAQASHGAVVRDLEGALDAFALRAGGA